MLKELCLFKREYGCLPESRFEWQELLGGAFANHVGRLLLYTDMRVFDVHARGKLFELKVWNTDDIVCFDDITGERLEIPTNGNLELLLDEESLAREVSKALGFEDLPLDIGKGFNLGHRRLGACLYPVFLCLDLADVETLVLRHVRHGERPVFYCVCKSLVAPKHKAIIAEANGLLENLYECFVVEESGIVCIRPLEDSADFKGTLKRNEQLATVWSGERPNSPNWGMLEIRFEDPDYMNIRFGRFSRDMHYLNLPFFVRVNGKLKSVKKHWWFLASLNSHDIPYDYRTHKNYLPAVRKFLKEFFGIDGDPLPVENFDGEKSIRPKLKIETSSQVKRRANIEGF